MQPQVSKHCHQDAAGRSLHSEAATCRGGSSAWFSSSTVTQDGGMLAVLQQPVQGNASIDNPESK